MHRVSRRGTAMCVAAIAVLVARSGAAQPVALSFSHRIGVVSGGWMNFVAFSPDGKLVASNGGSPELSDDPVNPPVVPPVEPVDVSGGCLHAQSRRGRSAELILLEQPDQSGARPFTWLAPVRHRRCHRRHDNRQVFSRPQPHTRQTGTCRVRPQRGIFGGCWLRSRC